MSSTYNTIQVLLLPLLLVAGTSAVHTDFADNRIIGGIIVKPSDILTHVASVQSVTGPKHLCGAAIISTKYLLTVAHCTAYRSASELRVRVGSKQLYENGVLHAVSQIHQHNKYNSFRRLNDVAIIRTVRPIVLTDTVRTVAIASMTSRNGINAVVAGWGRSRQNVNMVNEAQQLRKVTTTTMSNAECKRRYLAKNKPAMADNIGVGNVCTLMHPGKGVCTGDEGAPLMTANGSELIGLVSWTTKGQCANGEPDVYTRVAAYREWIESIVSED